MTTAQELQRLAKANEIINRSHKRLGIKPLFISDLKAIAEDMKTEPAQGPVSLVPEKMSWIFSDKAILSVAAIFALLSIMLVISSLDQESSGNVATFFRDNSGPSLVNIKKKASLAGVLSPKDKSVIISKGTYNDIKDAQEAKSKLFELTGTDIKIIKENNFYTLQIGPEYKNHDDALVVFDELSKYSLADLAIRLKN
jgi:hypothetical protein